MIEIWKIKAMIAKHQRARGRISLSNKEEEDYKSDTRDEINLDQGNGKHLLQP